MKNNKGEKKQTKKLLRKLGTGLEKQEVLGLYYLPPPKENCHAGRKSRGSPCSVFLVKPKNKKKPLDLQHQ